MKPPILLKLLRQISPKAPTRGSNSQAGFTLIELAIVVLVIGILSAIAAPSWLAFVSRQRTRTVNDGVFRALRSAQSEAKSNKKDVEVQFDVDADVPVITTDGVSETLNANGEIKDGMVDLVVAACNAKDINGNCTGYDYYDGTTDHSITFNSLGAIDDENDLPFAVTTATADGKGSKRCVIVQTILGSMRTASGDDCPEPDSW